MSTAAKNAAPKKSAAKATAKNVRKPPASSGATAKSKTANATAKKSAARPGSAANRKTRTAGAAT